MYIASPTSPSTRKPRTVAMGHFHSSVLSPAASIAKAYSPVPPRALLLNTSSPMPVTFWFVTRAAGINCQLLISLYPVTETLTLLGVPSGAETRIGIVILLFILTSPMCAQSPTCFE